MFGFLKAIFGEAPAPQPFQPPTAKQARYAKKLGIDIDGLSRRDVSDLIAQAEHENPGLAVERQAIVRNTREKKHGKELIAEEAQWNEWAETTVFILAIYKWRKDTVVDVLRVNDAFINGRGTLKLIVDAPVYTKSLNYLGWERDFELATNDILYHELLHVHFDDEAIKVYQSTVKRGLGIVKKLAK